MKFLHTSDLHLGRSLHSYDLSGAQRDMLNRIVDIAIERKVDAVLVAGDVYDRAFPPAEAVVQFEQFLARIRGANIAVVVVSGNHDQAERLGYGSSLFREGLYVLTDPRDVANPVRLRDDAGDVLIYGIPYLDPETVRRLYSRSDDELLPASHQAVVGEAMNRVRADLSVREGSPRVVVVSHAFVAGGNTSDSERDVVVGGLDFVPSSVFEGAHYVALGHLHGPQQPASVGTSAVLRYSGSPLRYSISEAKHTKSVTIVDLTAPGHVEIETVALDQPRPMADLRDTIDELLSRKYENDRESWVRLTVTDDQRPESMIPRLRDTFPHALEFQHAPQVAAAGLKSVHVDRASDPLEVTAEFVEQVRLAPLTESERALVADVIAAVNRQSA